MQLAQFNIGRILYDLDDPRVADFVNGIDEVNAAAERSPGFVWKYETEFGGAVEVDVDNDPQTLVNITVWDSLENLHQFVWKTLHRGFVARKAEWFKGLDQAHLAMWWVPDGHRPTLSEAQEKLDHLREHGDTDAAFGWRYAMAHHRGTGDAA